MARTKSNGTNTSTADLGFEAKLWLTADELRNNMDAAGYKPVLLGLIFLKYISDTFEEHRAKLLAGEGDSCSFAGAIRGSGAADSRLQICAAVLNQQRSQPE